MIKYKKKLQNSTTFNLTSKGRAILKILAFNHSISEGDVIENLVRNYADPLVSMKAGKITGPKGGAPSLYPGKNRGTTTAVCITATAKAVLDSQVTAVEVSRGDWVEYLLRQEAELESDIPELVLV